MNTDTRIINGQPIEKMNLTIGIDHDENLLLIDFGKELQWILIDVKQAKILRNNMDEWICKLEEKLSKLN
jgi:hypothetical protein